MTRNERLNQIDRPRSARLGRNVLVNATAALAAFATLSTPRESYAQTAPAAASGEMQRPPVRARTTGRGFYPTHDIVATLGEHRLFRDRQEAFSPEGIQAQTEILIAGGMPESYRDEFIAQATIQANSPGRMVNVPARLGSMGFRGADGALWVLGDRDRYVEMRLPQGDNRQGEELVFTAEGVRVTVIYPNDCLNVSEAGRETVTAQPQQSLLENGNVVNGGSQPQPPQTRTCIDRQTRQPRRLNWDEHIATGDDAGDCSDYWMAVAAGVLVAGGIYAVTRNGGGNETSHPFDTRRPGDSTNPPIEGSPGFTPELDVSALLQ